MRQDAQFLQSFMLARAILDAPLQTVEGAQPGDELKNIVEEYVNAIFPFQQADSKKEIQEMAEVLKRWVETVSTIEVEMLPDPAQQLRVARRIKRGADQQKLVDSRMSNVFRRRL